MIFIDIKKPDLDEGFSCKRIKCKLLRKEKLFKKAEKQMELIKSGVIKSKNKKLPTELKSLIVSDVEIESLRSLCKQKGINGSFLKFTIFTLFEVHCIKKLEKSNYSSLCNLINESKDNLDFKKLLKEISE